MAERGACGIAASSWKADAVLSALGTGRCSIDRVANRLGARSIRDVRGVKAALADLAARGRIEDCGDGIWSGPEAAPPDGRRAATSRDVIRLGICGATGGITLAAMARRIEGDGGIDASNLPVLLPPMIDAGLVAFRRPRRYVLTDEGSASLDTSEETQRPAGGPEARVLALLDVPMTHAGIAEALGVSHERARQVASGLVRDGRAKAFRIRRMQGALVTTYVAADVDLPSLERLVADALPAKGLADAGDIAALLDRHATDVTAALEALAAAGVAQRVAIEPYRTLWLRTSGAPAGTPAAATTPDFPIVPRAALVSMRVGPVDAAGLRELLLDVGKPTSTSRIAGWLARMAAEGLLLPEGDSGAHAPTAAGLRLADAFGYAL